MGVYCHGWLSKCSIQHHICCFTAYAWQRFKLLTCFGYLSLVLINQNLAGFNHIFSLGIIEPNGLDICLESLDTKIKDGLGCICHRIEFIGCLIDADIGCLCRKHHRNQQFKWR